MISPLMETTVAEATEADMADAVDKDHLDRAIRAEPLMIIKTLRALMRNQQTEWLSMRDPTGWKSVRK